MLPNLLKISLIYFFNTVFTGFSLVSLIQKESVLHLILKFKVFSYKSHASFLVYLDSAHVTTCHWTLVNHLIPWLETTRGDPADHARSSCKEAGTEEVRWGHWLQWGEGAKLILRGKCSWEITDLYRMHSHSPARGEPRGLEGSALVHPWTVHHNPEQSAWPGSKCAFFFFFN